MSPTASPAPKGPQARKGAIGRAIAFLLSYLYAFLAAIGIGKSGKVRRKPWAGWSASWTVGARDLGSSWRGSLAQPCVAEHPNACPGYLLMLMQCAAGAE